MIRFAASAIALALLAAPALANDPSPYDLALSRLRACVVSGAAGAPTTDLRAALIAVRSLCAPQINRAYAASDAKVAREHPGTPTAKLRNLREDARRRIDRDLAVLVAAQTGLSQ